MLPIHTEYFRGYSYFEARGYVNSVMTFRAKESVCQLPVNTGCS
jgi:hypothetical protein